MWIKLHNYDFITRHICIWNMQILNMWFLELKANLLTWVFFCESQGACIHIHCMVEEERNIKIIWSSAVPRFYIFSLLCCLNGKLDDPVLASVTGPAYNFFYDRHLAFIILVLMPQHLYLWSTNYTYKCIDTKITCNNDQLAQVFYIFIMHN